ncbi:MAG: hypothetical protein II816_00385, partial [Elusimicrobia bacterium]|nr:hypothetical protein [Elusimicrobiota bacterium]
SLIKNILDEIKNYRFQDYFDILNVLRKELPIPYSYWEENKIKRKNSFSRFTNRTSKEEIDEFISSVILAQPDLKRDILKIIRDKLLLKEKFSYKIMLLLISIDTLENTNSLLTEKDVYFEIAETIKFLPKKDYYTLEDYQHISDYAFLFQDSVVADIINYTKRNYPILYPYIEQEIKNIINFSLNYRFNRKISLYIKANDIVSFIKNRISKQQSFKNEDIVMLLYMETLLGDIKDLLFKRHKLDNKVFNLVNNLNLDKQYYTKYAYEQILDYCNDNHLLSADYRIKILNFLGITDFQKQQEIISVWEYPQIILGIFFPKIRERFKNSHSKDIEEKLSVLENDTAEKIREIFNLSVEEIKEFSFFNKIITVGKILINSYIQTYNRIRHLELNGANIPQTEIDVFYEDFFEKFSDISIDEKMKILVATDTENFNQKDLINTGLKVNGNTIWQVRNADKILIFVADNATISDIAETLNGYKNLNKQIKKLARLKNLIRINSFIFKNGKITPLKDTNKPVENELSTERLQTNIDASFYINILATA